MGPYAPPGDTSANLADQMTCLLSTTTKPLGLEVFPGAAPGFRFAAAVLSIIRRSADVPQRRRACFSGHRALQRRRQLVRAPQAQRELPNPGWHCSPRSSTSSTWATPTPKGGVYEYMLARIAS